MKIEFVIFLCSLIAAVVGFFAGNLLRKKLTESKIASTEEQAVKILEEAKRQAEIDKKTQKSVTEAQARLKAAQAAYETEIAKAKKQ